MRAEHGLRRDEEALADLLVCEAVREQTEHLPLALRQRGHRIGVRTDEHACEHRVDVRLPGGDSLDGTHQLGERRLLEHEAAHADVERFGEQRAVAVRGVEDDRSARRGRRRFLRDLDPGDAGHSDVDERDARLLRLDLGKRFLPIGGEPHDLDAVLRQNVGHRRQHRGMVVGDHTSDRLAHAGPVLGR